MSIEKWNRRVARARESAHRVLAGHELAESRVILLEDVIRRLNGLPVDVYDYFRESVRCLEGDLRRASVVMAWAGYFHVFVEALLQEKASQVSAQYPKWPASTASDLKESVVEFQIIEAARKVGFIQKSTMHQLHGHLATRNQCAHPTLYSPSRNEAIGYLDAMTGKTMKLVGSSAA